MRSDILQELNLLQTPYIHKPLPRNPSDCDRYEIIKSKQPTMQRITKKQYLQVFKDNRTECLDNMCVHESYTDIDGTCPLGNGNPQWVTVWGLRETQTPLIKAHSESINGVIETKYYSF